MAGYHENTATTPDRVRADVLSRKSLCGLGMRAAVVGGRPVAPVYGRCRAAFTLSELLVSVAILALLLMTVGAIFAMSTKAASLSNANNEVLNNLRAFEQQIRRDLQGLRKDAFVAFCYNHLPPRPLAPGRPESAAVRADWLVFFADGDFQTIGQRWVTVNAQTGEGYFSRSGGRPVEGSLARIQYGMLGTHSATPPTTGQISGTLVLSNVELGRSVKLITRDFEPRQNNNDPQPPRPVSFPLFLDPTLDPGPGGALNLWDANLAEKERDIYENWEFEYETIADWRDPARWPAYSNNINIPSYENSLIGVLRPGLTQRNNLWLGLGYTNPTAAGFYRHAEEAPHHLRMIPGCVSFKIQRWAETDPVNPGNGRWVARWWPEEGDINDDDGDPATAPMNPLPNGPFGPPTNEPGLRIWEVFNGPLDDLPAAVIGTRGAGDWPQATNDTQSPWPWIRRVPLGQRALPARGAYDPQRVIPADFPKAVKITLALIDSNRRLLETAQPGPANAGTIPGTQTFTLIIPLE